MKRGGFYYLPIQARLSSRPCDVVFVDETWGPRSTKLWDESGWEQRLNMFSTGKFPIHLATG